MVDDSIWNKGSAAGSNPGWGTFFLKFLLMKKEKNGTMNFYLAQVNFTLNSSVSPMFPVAKRNFFSQGKIPFCQVKTQRENSFLVVNSFFSFFQVKKTYYSVRWSLLIQCVEQTYAYE